MIDPIEHIIDRYLSAKSAVIEAGFAHEIDWQERLNLAELNESSFLRESAWVILSSGMSWRTIDKVFPRISQAFLLWCNAAEIVRWRRRCTRAALKTFSNERKIAAIADIADRVARDGFEHLKGRLAAEGVSCLRTMPFMGPATSYHLGKNIGLDVVKPDRHLVRVAGEHGYAAPFQLCHDISRAVGDRITVVDLVLWRFETLRPNAGQAATNSRYDYEGRRNAKRRLATHSS